MNHIATGKHKYKAERESAMEFVEKNYITTLRTVNLQTIRRAQEQLLEAVETDEPTQPQGWALKSTPATTRFSLEQRKYLAKKFDEGEINSEGLGKDLFILFINFDV